MIKVLTVLMFGLLFASQAQAVSIEATYSDTQYYIIDVEEMMEEPTMTFAELTIVDTGKDVAHSTLDAFCLAKNIYHEARGENLLGQLAVAQVTLNRLKSKRYPDTICHVVLQRAQFSWANHKPARWSHPKGKAWESAKHISDQVLNNGVRVKGLETALYYHADWVDPKWKDPEAKIAQIGTHIFYEKAKPL